MPPLGAPRRTRMSRPKTLEGETRPTTVNIPTTLHVATSARAQKLGVTISELTRRALTAYLKALDKREEPHGRND